jgi:hypothetical protein
MPSTLESSKSLLVISTPTCSRSSKKNRKGEGQVFHLCYTYSTPFVFLTDTFTGKFLFLFRDNLSLDISI